MAAIILAIIGVLTIIAGALYFLMVLYGSAIGEATAPGSAKNSDFFWPGLVLLAGIALTYAGCAG